MDCSKSNILHRSILKNATIDGASVMSPKGGNRTANYQMLRAFLKHMRDDAKDITSDMFYVLDDLLVRENWELIGAYELYILDNDREELIDTLFSFYQVYSGTNQIEERADEQAKSKQSLGGVVFHYKSRFDQKIYDKLADLVRSGDKKIKEFHELYKIERDEKKFIANLNEYALEKIKRIEEFKSKLKDKTVEKIDWKKELAKYIEVLSRNVPLPDGLDYDDLINVNEDVSKGIYDVYIHSGKDQGEFIENLKLLRKRAAASKISFNA